MTLPSATSRTLIGFFLVPFLIMIGMVSYASYLVLEIKKLEHRVIQASGEWHRLHLSSHLAFTFSSESDDELRQWRKRFNDFDTSIEHLQSATEWWLIGEPTKNHFRNMREVWSLTKSKLETSLSLFISIRETPLGRQLSHTSFSSLVDMATQKINETHFPKENIWKFYRLQDHLTDLSVAGEVLEELMDHVSSEIEAEARFLINAIIITTLASALLVLFIAFILNKNALAVRERTERSLREGRTALLARERYLQGVLDNIADAVVTIDERGEIETLNYAAANLFGFSAQEAHGQNVSILMPDPDCSRHDDYINAYRETGEGKILGFGNREVMAQHKDGHTFPLEICVGEVKLSDRRVFIGAMRDITERMQAEDALREGEERFRGIIENSPSAILLKDLEGRFQLANSRFEEWYGISTAEISGKTSHDIHSEDEAELYVAQDKEVIATESTSEWERDIPFADGTLHTIIVTKFPVRDGTGRIVGVGTFNTDVTEHKKAEEQLRQAQRMEAVGQLTAGVAHDFNNMLAVTLGNAELLEDELGEDNPHLAAVYRATKRATDLTQRLLAFSRKQVLVPEIINANNLIADITGLLRRTLEEHIDIEAVTGAGLWNCEVDPAQLENALVNLGLNARDAMPDGGKLTIETANVRLDDDYAAAQADVTPGQYVMLAVTDTGTGMPPEVREHVFELFFTTKEVGAGSGLGLSMVYGFVKQSGGHVTIYSEEGEGTTIKLYLPCSTAAKTVERKPAADDVPVAQGETVLVVEDDPDVRTLAVSLLSSLGYQIMEAATGAAALEQLGSTTRANLLLTDVMLAGGMNGRELAAEAKQCVPGLPVLYMSGYTEDAIMHHGRLDADAELLQKPFRRADLAGAVRRALDGPSV